MSLQFRRAHAFCRLTVRFAMYGKAHREKRRIKSKRRHILRVRNSRNGARARPFAARAKSFWLPSYNTSHGSLKIPKDEERKNAQPCVCVLDREKNGEGERRREMQRDRILYKYMCFLVGVWTRNFVDVWSKFHRCMEYFIIEYAPPHMENFNSFVELLLLFDGMKM